MCVIHLAIQLAVCREDTGPSDDREFSIKAVWGWICMANPVRSRYVTLQAAGWQQLAVTLVTVCPDLRQSSERTAEGKPLSIFSIISDPVIKLGWVVNNFFSLSEIEIKYLQNDFFSIGGPDTGVYVRNWARHIWWKNTFWPYPPALLKGTVCNILTI